MRETTRPTMTGYHQRARAPCCRERPAHTASRSAPRGCASWRRAAGCGDGNASTAGAQSAKATRCRVLPNRDPDPAVRSRGLAGVLRRGRIVPNRSRRTAPTGSEVIDARGAECAIRVFSVLRKGRKRGPAHEVRWHVACRGHARTFAPRAFDGQSARPPWSAAFLPWRGVAPASRAATGPDGSRSDPAWTTPPPAAGAASAPAAKSLPNWEHARRRPDPMVRPPVGHSAHEHDGGPAPGRHRRPAVKESPWHPTRLAVLDHAHTATAAKAS